MWCSLLLYGRLFLSVSPENRVLCVFPPPLAACPAQNVLQGALCGCGCLLQGERPGSASSSSSRHKMVAAHLDASVAGRTQIELCKAFVCERVCARVRFLRLTWFPQASSSVVIGCVCLAFGLSTYHVSPRAEQGSVGDAVWVDTRASQHR